MNTHWVKVKKSAGLHEVSPKLPMTSLLVWNLRCVGVCGQIMSQLKDDTTVIKLFSHVCRMQCWITGQTGLFTDRALCPLCCLAANNLSAADERRGSCDRLPAVRLQHRCHQCPSEGELHVRRHVCSNRVFQKVFPTNPETIWWRFVTLLAVYTLILSYPVLVFNSCVGNWGGGGGLGGEIIIAAFRPTRPKNFCINRLWVIPV